MKLELTSDQIFTSMVAEAVLVLERRMQLQFVARELATRDDLRIEISL